MPKEGFKSITMSETVYGQFSNAYKKQKGILNTKGIRSLSGFVSHLIGDALDNAAFLENGPRLRLVHAETGRLVILDTEVNRIAEVVNKDDVPYCMLCQNGDCVHVGFAHANPKFF